MGHILLQWGQLVDFGLTSAPYWDGSDYMTTDRYIREIAEDAWCVLAAAIQPPFMFQRGQLFVDDLQI